MLYIYTGNPKPVFCDNLEEWNGDGGGREVSKGGNKCIPIPLLLYGTDSHDIVKLYTPIKNKIKLKK